MVDWIKVLKVCVSKRHSLLHTCTPAHLHICTPADCGQPGVQVAVVNLADAVTHARFVGSDASSDKVVLMKILDVLDVLIISKVTQDLLKPVWHFPPSQVGLMLTNKSICEIMQSSLRICFELRLSEENGPTLSGRHHGPASSIPASQASLKSRRRCSRSSRCAAPMT